MPEIGKPAPAFTLLNQDGEKTSLEDFRGRKVLVYFFPGGRHSWVYPAIVWPQRRE